MAATDAILSKLSNADSRTRSAGLDELSSFLTEDQPTTEELIQIVDALAPLLDDNNANIALGSLSALEQVVNTYGEYLDDHFVFLVQAITDKFADVKAKVRERSQDIIVDSIMSVFVPKQIMDMLDSRFSHANWRVREQMIVLLKRALVTYGVDNIPLEYCIEKIPRSLEDINASVREVTLQLIEELYKTIGDPLVRYLENLNLKSALMTSLRERLENVQVNSRPILVPSLGGAAPSTTNRSAQPMGDSGKLKSSVPKKVTGSDKGINDFVQETKIKKIKVHGDKDLQRELENIQTIIANEAVDWKPKADALIKLQGILLGGAEEYDCLVPLLIKMKNHISNQMLNLRSALVREACSTVKLMSIILLDAFDPLLDTLLSTLFKLIISAVSIISEAGSNTLRAIVSNCRSERIIPIMVLAGKSSQHTALRLRVVQSVGVILAQHPEYAERYSAFKRDGKINGRRHLDVVDELLTSTFEDAMGDVRAAARLTFSSLNAAYPDRARRIFQSAPPNVQKHLFDSYQKDEKKATRPGLSSSGSNVAAMNGPKRPHSSGHGSTLEPNFVPQKTFSTSNPNLPIATLKSNTAPAALAVKKPSRLPMGSHSENDLFLVPERPAEKKPTSGPNSPGTRPKGPKRTASRPELPAGPSTTSVPTTAVNLAAAVHEHTTKNQPQRVKQLVVDKTNEIKVHQKQEENHSTTVSAKPASAPLSRKAKPVAIAPKSSSAISSTMKRTPILSSSEEITAVLDKAASTLWSTRVECFSLIASACSSETSLNIPNHFDRIMTTCINHTNDPHCRVVSQALEAINTLIDFFESHCRPYVEKIMAAALKRGIDPKDTVRESVGSTVRTLFTHYDPLDVNTYLFKMADNPNISLRSAALEYATKYVKEAGRYYRGLPLLSDKSANLSRLSSNLLVQLYGHYHTEFISAVLLLPIHLQLDLRRHIGAKLPQFETDLGLSSQAVEKRGKHSQAVVDAIYDDFTDTVDIPSPPVARRILQENSPAKTYRTPVVDRSEKYDSEEEDSPPLARGKPKEGWEASSTTLKNGWDKPNDPMNAYVLTTAPRSVGRRKDVVPAHIEEIAEILKEGDPSTTEQKRDALHELIRTSKENSPEVWPHSFTCILISLLDVIKHPDPFLRELSIIVLKELLKNQSARDFEAFVDAVLYALLERTIDNKKDVSQAALECIEQATFVFDPERCVNTLLEISDPKNTALRYTIHALSKFLLRVPVQQLLRLQNTFTPRILECVNSGVTEVRKAAVFCLVDLRLYLGDTHYQQVFVGLNYTQHKLVQIYYGRKLKGNENIDKMRNLFLTLLLLVLFAVTGAASSIFYDAPPTIESGIADREAFLISQWNAQLSDLQRLDSWTLMSRLNKVNSQYGVYVSPNAYLGDAAAALNSTWRRGASTLLLASLTYNLTQHMDNAISQAGNNPDVNESQERGSIAYSVYLLNRANAYLQYTPLQAPAGTVQNAYENFTLAYSEATAAARGVRVWVSTGYNKEIAQTLIAGTTIGIYGEVAAAKYFPNATSAFFLFWNSMVGKTGAYEIDNTPHYGTFNTGMMFHLAVVLNRLNRGTQTDTNAYMSDSPDIKRIMDRMVLQMSGTGDTPSYHKAAGSSAYQYVYVTSGQAVWPLRMAYMMTGNVTYLWASRKIDRFYYNVMPNHTAVFDDLTHANIQRYDLLNLEGPASTTQPTQSFLRVSTMYYKGMLINRGATNANTVLVPDKIILRTSSHDLSSWAVLGLSGAGHHANTDQRLCLDNSMFMGAYMVHRYAHPFHYASLRTISRD
ncbi:hypothetical protein PROFUN_05996 [Planoprotostelium fungivorum]|uniref:TOG domain-containing protein n=1 Tax=Planoprotostelium fungivorum TaxID=1890364 RepID=A0A2P6NPC1_9EUKA|nr:hypothetical protein PROFUN_05996 [Planoprotostelium fungivorum]